MDMKTRVAEFWQATCKKVGSFFNKTGDYFKNLLKRFRKTEDHAAESAAAEMNEPAAPEKTVEAAAPQTAFQKVCKILKNIGIWVFRLRRIFMAIPVIWCSIWLASYNSRNLPEQVGLNLQATGEFATVIDRSLAVYVPLGVTGACLALMFFSRRARYPWIISIFTLVLPWLILLTNIYPQ